MAACIGKWTFVSQENLVSFMESAGEFVYIYLEEKNNTQHKTNVC